MSIRISVSGFLLLIAISCNTKKEQAAPSILATSIDSLLKSAPDFSGVILIAEKGNPIYYKATGYKDFEKKELLDTATIFELASVSKAFTAMIIMMLEEDSLLNYDDPIEKYIPALPYQGITIRHLLNHTSGLPDYQSIMDKYWDKTQVADNNDNINYLTKYKSEKIFEPREKYEYSNTGYMLLATVAEKASGRDFIQLCRERIFIPLQMTDTDIRTNVEKEKLSNMARGHLYVAEKQRYILADSFPEFNYTIWLGDRKGPGRISSTARDMLKWDRALHTEKLVKASSLQEAFTPARLKSDSLTNYGFGWFIEQNPAVGKIVFHYGENPGYKTFFIRYHDADKTVILLNNNAHEKFETLAKVITDQLKNQSVPH